MKDYEGGKKCLSPSIFRKNKAPLIVGTMSSISGPPTSASSDTTNKGPTMSGKRGESTLGQKEFSIADMDVN